ncbi:protein of unknown function [Acetoanaerobium sticklandii]|uniref:DUF927 domain-containing protein n=1 Tax=Acetoanaerobium sticklandii (strain ATCC 12662 / DSM 519 / JCM 1433 / CCUG 9281 / NCIMB 10654 / HF) TaxID=499177 RepID=E3PVT2_ACESD|nr:DUF927 domain-containing protein [Acetoanaerobium sticklandii]CBH22635.1 protein of unknown function [Acetoanaerobium sticklandii]
MEEQEVAEQTQAPLHRSIDVDFINGGIYTLDKEGNPFYLVREMNIDHVESNILTDDEKLEILYIRNGKVKSLVMNRSDFTKHGLLRILPSKGIDITDANAPMVHEVLLMLEEQAEHINIHDSVGWYDIDGQRVFLHHDAIGYDQPSEYRGIHNIEPKGTLDEYLQGINDLVIGRYPLELSLVLGLSAPIASRLRKIIGLEVIFVHIYGFSTTGKSTALMLALSTFGYPGKSNNGLQKSWIATYNALIGFLAGVHGIPIGMDEASVRANKDYSNIIYTIAEGKDKARQNQDGVNKNAEEWSGVVISTGENSLLSSSNANQGIRVRNTEIADVTFTDSAEHAEQIKIFAQKNYGHIGVEFVKALQRIDDDELLFAFEKSKASVLDMMPVKDQFTDRIANKFAVIYMTVILANKYLNLTLNKEEVLKILIEADSKQHDDRNLPLKAYEYMKSEISKNINKFIYKADLKGFTTARSYEDQKVIPHSEVIGRILTRAGVDRREGKKRDEDDKKYDAHEFVEVAIISDVFRKMLSDGGFTNSEIILRRWRELGIIETDENKLTKKRTIIPKTKGVRCVIINFDNVFEPEKKKSKKKINDENKLNRTSMLFDEEDDEKETKHAS